MAFSARWRNDFYPLAFQPCLPGRVIHGLDTGARQVVPAEVGGVQPGLEEDRFLAAQAEITQHAVVTDVDVLRRAQLLASPFGRHPPVGSTVVRLLSALAAGVDVLD